jgi:hypothetical protein
MMNCTEVEGVTNTVCDLVADSLGFDQTINDAQAGSGMDRIVWSTQSHYIHHPEHAQTHLAIIQCTAPSRVDYPTTGGTHHRWDWGMLRQRPHMTGSMRDCAWDRWFVQRWYSQVITLQDFFRVRGIRWVMYSGLAHPRYLQADEVTWREWQSAVARPNYYDIAGESHYDQVLRTGHTAPDGHHPDDQGNREWAQMITRHILTVYPDQF